MASQSQLSRGVSNVNNNIANRSADRLSVRGVYDHTDDATGTGTRRQRPTVYSSQTLRHLRKARPRTLSNTVVELLRQLGLLHRRGCRGAGSARRSTDHTRDIPVIVRPRHQQPRQSAVREERTNALQPIHRRLSSPVKDHSSTSTVLGLLNARSLSSKSSAIYDLIVADRLHICTVVETWHDSVDSPQLIACTPPGYRYIERARPRSTSAALTTNCNHGGLCLFYASFLSAREVQLPTYTSGIEVLAVYLRGAGRNMLAIVLYRPGSAATTNAFFDDFADVLERASSFACPFVLLGDVNIHLDVPTHPDTIKWQSILDSHDLVQHVTSATHCAGHTLDVVVTLSDCPVHNVCVQPPSLSDHSVITASVELHLGRGQLAGSVHRRQWRQFDCDAFCDDLRQSDLLLAPPANVVNLVACYNDTLWAMLDKHAPFTTIKPCAHINSPWYDRQCQQAKAVTRRLERAYRRTKLSPIMKHGGVSQRCSVPRCDGLTLTTGRRR